VADTCDGCGFCVSHFECPALVLLPVEKRVTIDAGLCSGCGVCVHVCPKNSLRAGSPAII
jgi:indolepyruvate ferredoxin oxidoreductase alpha subunit